MTDAQIDAEFEARRAAYKLRREQEMAALAANPPPPPRPIPKTLPPVPAVAPGRQLPANCHPSWLEPFVPPPTRYEHTRELMRSPAWWLEDGWKIAAGVIFTVGFLVLLAHSRDTHWDDCIVDIASAMHGEIVEACGAP